MNLFRLARMYPTATTETEAVRAAEADIAGIDRQISDLTIKRTELAQLIDSAEPQCPRVETHRNNPRTGKRQCRLRADGTHEYLYTNDTYSKWAYRLKIGTRDEGADSYLVWLSGSEVATIYGRVKARASLTQQQIIPANPHA